MHPNAAFRMDEGAARAFVAEEGFGVLFATTPDGPRAAQLPVTVTPQGSLCFHLARTNALAPHLAGATVLFVAQGPHAYVSPRWYGAGPDEVPTWNYVSVEVEGVVRPLDRAALRGQIDTMAAGHEDEPWAIDSIDPRKAEAMLGAIAGFELVPGAWRGTAKLSQNKPQAVRERVTARLGDHPLAAWMRTAMLGGALLLGACDPLEDTDWLLAAVRSPDGTLADGQANICRAMALAFAGAGLPPPDPRSVRRIVGLSLPQAVARLAPALGEPAHHAVAEGYKRHFRAMRTDGTLADEPLFPGIAAALTALRDTGWRLGVATGKSDRGLALLLAHHGLARYFTTLQTADRHPSKPHPAMLEAAMAQAGASAAGTVMIGDTGFDMGMARAAGVRAVGVTWGYHAADELTAAGADVLAHDAADLPRLLETA